MTDEKTSRVGVRTFKQDLVDGGVGNKYYRSSETSDV